MLSHKITQLAGAIRYGYQFQNREKIILRDYMAMERTRLANERTFMSYIRTALFFLTGGLTILEFKTERHLDWLAYLAIGISIIMIITGISRYFILSTRLRKYYLQIKEEEKLVKVENKEKEEVAQG